MMRLIPLAVIAVLAVLVVALTACGPPEAEPPAAEPPVLAADCADLEPLTGQPAEVGPDPAPDPATVREWAEAEAPDSYAGIWLDREAGGVTVAFAEQADRYRDEVRDRFGDGVRLAEADHSYAELQAVMDALIQEMGPGGPEPGDITSAGLSETLNRVSIGVFAADESRRAELSERYGADRICLEVEPVPGEEQALVATWEPTPEADLAPDVTEIPLLVNERACASGEPANDRIPEPDIDYGTDTVTVTIRVIPRPGGQDCPSNPDTPYTLILDEPLGDRDLLDGGQDPPGRPAIDR